MHAGLLIDSIVRQTTVLVASLATASGQRTQLAHVANLAFADLVRELRQQGLGNKVISDMFGMALRWAIASVWCGYFARRSTRRRVSCCSATMSATPMGPRERSQPPTKIATGCACCSFLRWAIAIHCSISG